MSKLFEFYTCANCHEAYVPDPRPFGRRACPGCGGENITPITSLLSDWARPWRREEMKTA